MKHLGIVATLLGGCTIGEDPKNGEDLGPYCEDTPTVVALDEATELGFSAEEVLALAEGTHLETLTWARDGSATELTLEVVYDGGEARFVDSEAVYPEDGTSPAIAVICDDRVEVDVTVSFSTADGAFDEVWDLALRAVSPDTTELSVELDPDALGGTYDMDADITATDWDDRSLWARGGFDAAGTRGEVSGQVSGEEDCEDGDVCSAWAEMVEVGTWGAN